MSQENLNQISNSEYENLISNSLKNNNIKWLKDIDEIIKSRNYYDTISIEILNSENQLERFNFR